MLSLLEKEFLFNSDVCKLCDYARSEGFQPVFKECLRPVELAALYKSKGLSWLADPRQDKHVQGLAIDICFFRGCSWVKDYMMLAAIGKYWQSLRPGNVWGGSWGVRDCLHFQAS